MKYGSKNKSKNIRLIKRYIERIECDPHTYLYMDCLIDDIFYETKLKTHKSRVCVKG